MIEYNFDFVKRNKIFIGIFFAILFCLVSSYMIILNWKIECQNLDDLIIIPKGASASSVAVLLEKEECIKLEDVDGYGNDRATIQGKHSNDMSGDEPTKWEKVEECIPSEDTDSDNNFKPFLNYEDSDWQKDDYQWLKNEDGTNIEKK